MNILTNAEIASKFNVSRPTVTRWVELAEQSKNNLQLTEFNGKIRVLDNPHNLAELSRLTEEGKKWKRNLPAKIVTASSKINKIFSEDELAEIINDLEFKKELNLKFAYNNEAAELWDKIYLNKSSPINQATLDLIGKLEEEISYYLDKPKQLNIVDIGPGNSYPVKNFLLRLANLSILNKYTAIDISQSMLNIALANVRNWLPNLEVESHQKDLEINSLIKVLLENKSVVKNTPNIILLIGNTLSNYNDRIGVLKNLRKAMANNDLLIITFSLDNEQNRAIVNYAKSSDADKRHTQVLKLLGIDAELCELDVEYKEELNAKIKTLKLDKDYEIDINIFSEIKKLNLYSGTKISVWKHFLMSLEDFLIELRIANLEVLLSKKDSSSNNCMVICRAK